MAVSKVIFDGDTLIDLTGDTVTEDKLAEGITAHNAKGEQITGTMSGGGSGDDAAIDGLLEDSLVDLVSGATSVDPYSAYQRNALKTVNLPNATTIGIYAFNTCSVLNSFTAPSATSIGNYAFSNCTKLTELNLPSVKTIGNYSFQACTGLSRIDIGAAVTQIGAQAFSNAPITAFIIRRTSGVPSLTSTSAFANSGIAKGTGYIYVPSALVTSYQSATNWKNYANQIRAIEDYPDICNLDTEYTVNVFVNLDGAGTVTPSTYTGERGSQVTITAQANEGYQFVFFRVIMNDDGSEPQSIPCGDHTDNPLSFTLIDNVNRISAFFEEV